MEKITYSFKAPQNATQVQLFLDGEMHSLHNVVPGEVVDIQADVDIGVEHKFQVFIAKDDGACTATCPVCDRTNPCVPGCGWFDEFAGGK